MSELWPVGLLFFFLKTFSKKNLLGIPSVSNSFDPDQAQCFVGPDLGPNCFQRLSADDKVVTSGERVALISVILLRQLYL